jgi:hypothetical protein
MNKIISKEITTLSMKTEISSKQMNKLNKFKNWLRKIDFLLPLTVGALLIYWISSMRSPYVGYFIFTIGAIIASRSRWKWINSTAEYKNECKTANLRRGAEEKEEEKTKSSLVYRLEGGKGVRECFVILILLTLYLLITTLLRNEYLYFFICLGVEFYFISSLLFFMIKKARHKYWKPTIIILSLIVIYFVILFLIFY